jgi:hypothetical protein
MTYIPCVGVAQWRWCRQGVPVASRGAGFAACLPDAPEQRGNHEIDGRGSEAQPGGLRRNCRFHQNTVRRHRVLPRQFLSVETYRLVLGSQRLLGATNSAFAFWVSRTRHRSGSHGERKTCCSTTVGHVGIGLRRRPQDPGELCRLGGSQGGPGRGESGATPFANCQPPSASLAASLKCGSVAADRVGVEDRTVDSTAFLP